MMIRRDYNRAARLEGVLARQRARDNSSGVDRGLDHLPARNRAELAFAVDVLRTSFDQDRSRRQSSELHDGKILKIILYGSYARGDWVEDPVGRYFSDYDLLVVVEDERHTDVLEFWKTAEDRLLDELCSGRLLKTEANFIVHSIADVNDQLSRGRYFFMDILQEGILLFEEPGHPFVEPQPLAPATALAEAEGYCKDMMESVDDALMGAEFYVSRRRSRKAAFELHQAAESLYTGLLLVTTLYAPKTHNLVRLRKFTEPNHPELVEAWSADSRFHRRCFRLLNAAYVKARYSRHYRVTLEELAWMRERIKLLQARVIAICEARLSELRSGKA